MAGPLAEDEGAPEPLRREALALLGAARALQAQTAPESERADLERRAERAFARLVARAPEAELDPLLYPPTARRLFERVRAERGPPAARGRERSERSAPRTVYVERSLRRRSFALVFAPFGVGQFQNGSEIKGTLLAAGQALAVAVNIGSYLFVQATVREAGGRFAAGDERYARAKDAQTLMYGSLGALGVLYGVGVADAWYHYEPEALLQLRTLERAPPELEPASRLGLSWRFSF